MCDNCNITKLSTYRNIDNYNFYCNELTNELHTSINLAYAPSLNEFSILVLGEQLTTTPITYCPFCGDKLTW